MPAPVFYTCFLTAHAESVNVNVNIGGLVLSPDAPSLCECGRSDRDEMYLFIYFPEELPPSYSVNVFSAQCSV